MNPNPSGHRPPRPLDPSHLRPQRRVFDISRPGRTPASATSRPVAASRNPAVQDMSVRAPGMGAQRPMLNPHPVTAPPAPNGMDSVAPQPQAVVPSSVPVSRTAPVIAPLPSAPQPPAVPAPQALASPSSAPRLVMPPAVTTLTRPSVQPPQQAAAAPDDIPENLGPVQITDDEPVLISKHVPKDVSAKWRWIIAGSLVFLLLLVVFDVLLDADFITLRQVPHTHFF